MEALAEALKFDTGTFLAQLVSFLLLVVLLRAVAYKPILKALDERKKYIDDTISGAESRQQEAERLLAQYQQELKQAKQEAHDILERAKKQAQDESQEALDAAKREAARIKEDAKKEITRERDKAVEQLRDHVATLSVLAAGKIIEKNIDAKSQRKLVDEFMNEVGKLPC